MEQEILSSSKQKKGDNKMNTEFVDIKKIETDSILDRKTIISEISFCNIKDIEDIREWYNQGDLPIGEKRKMRRKTYTETYMVEIEIVDQNTVLVRHHIIDIINSKKYKDDEEYHSYMYVSSLFMKDVLDYVYASKLIERISYDDLIGNRR